MAYSIYVATKYTVKYDNDGLFSGLMSTINRLLFEECPNFIWMGDDFEYAEHIEIPRNELANLIGKIASNRDSFNQKAKQRHMYVTSDEFICILADWISKSDPRNEYVVLNWH